MNLKVGDILQNGLNFYRIYNVGKDIVMNQILYNPRTEKLQITHKYSFAEWYEVGDTKLYKVHYAENPETTQKLEMIKRKYKLEKLNNINE